MRKVVERGAVSATFVGSVLAVLLALSGVGYAATKSHELTLGKVNKASKGTTLRSKGGPTLALTNTTGKPAARFNVLKGKPPFAVSSRVKVIGLNADLLDGLDSAAFQRRVTGSCAPGSAIRLIDANGSVACVSTLSPPPPPPPASWNLTGNAGTTPGTDFLGTTDAQPLVIRTNNAEALRITSDGNVGIGTSTPRARVDAAASDQTAVNGTSSTGDGVDGASSGSGAGVRGFSPNGPGVVAESGGIGVSGTSFSAPGVVGASRHFDGVQGGSDTANGVSGTSNSADGLNGQSDSGSGVNGNSSSGIGVNGQSNTAIGVSGTSVSAVGVSGSSDSSTGVHGLANSGPGVVGTSSSTDGVEGNSDTGNGVGGTSNAGAGVVGSSAHDGVRGVTNHPSGGGTAAAVDAINTGGGDIFIGQVPTSPPGTFKHVARIDSAGKGFFDGGTATTGADYAESMRVSGSANTLAPGDVLAIDPRRSGEVRLSDGPDSQFVAGVYSTKPSVLALGDHGIDDSLAGNVPVAMLGIVPTKVSAENGAVKPGDLLVTARTPGYAMKASSVVVGGIAIYPTGAILGKALEPLREGSGAIEVLVTLR